MPMKKTALFPGSFDPLTVGHVDIIKRGLPLFDEIIVAIGFNSEKKYFFPLDKREAFIRGVFEGEPKIRVMTYSGLTVDFCRKAGAGYMIRGLRTSADFEFERAIAQMNRSMAPEVETVFLVSDPALSHISSTIVREILNYKGDVSAFVPPQVRL
jgi:pantetheine-phosphate adenylyltransferase